MIEAQAFTAGAFGENGYLATCSNTSHTIAIDPGAGAVDMVRALGAGELILDAIVLTHAHLDHIEGVAEVRRYAEVPIYLHPDDRGLYEAGAAQAAAFGLAFEVPPPPDVELLEGDVVEFGEVALRVLHTPGHAPGHVILVCDDDGLAFVGDVVFMGSIGRTDLPGGNFGALMDSIRDHVLTLPDETRLLTGHGPETTVGHERRGNPFLIPHYGGELA